METPSLFHTAESLLKPAGMAGGNGFVPDFETNPNRCWLISPVEGFLASEMAIPDGIYIYIYMCMQIYHIKYIGRLSILDGQIPIISPFFLNTPFADITSDPQYTSMFGYNNIPITLL